MYQPSQNPHPHKVRPSGTHKTKHKAVQNTDQYNRRKAEEQQIKEIFWRWFFKESLLTVVEFFLCLVCLIFALVFRYRWPDIVLASVFLTLTKVDLVSWFVIRPITYHCWIMVSTAGFLSFCLYTGHLLFQNYDWKWCLGIVVGAITAVIFLVDLILLLIRFKRFPNPYWVAMYYSEMIEATTCTYGEKLPEDDMPVCYCGENGGEKCRCGRPPTPDLCTCCECGTEFEIAKQTCFNLGTQVDMPRPSIKFLAEGGKHPDPYETEGREMIPSNAASRTSVDPREAVPDETARKWRKALKDHELASIHSMRDNITFRRTPCPLPGTATYYDDDDFFPKKPSAAPPRKPMPTTGSATKRSLTTGTSPGGGGGGCACASPIASIFDRSTENRSSGSKRGSFHQDPCAPICPGSVRTVPQSVQQPPQTIQYFCDDNGPPSKRTATGPASPGTRASRDGSKSPTRRSADQMGQPRKTSKGDLSKGGVPGQLSHLTNIQDHMVDSRYLAIGNSCSRASVENMETPYSMSIADDGIFGRRRSRSVQPRNSCTSETKRSQSAFGTDTNTRVHQRNIPCVIRRPSVSSDMHSSTGMIRNAATVVRPGTGHAYSPRSSQNYIVQSPRFSVDSSPRNRCSTDYSPRSSHDGQPPSSPVYIRR